MAKSKLPSALKHAAYSAMTLLPGEDPAEFEKLHKDLISDLAPDGPLEEDVVATIARLLWRKQNLQSFRVAQHAKERLETIRLLWRRHIAHQSFRDRMPPAVVHRAMSCDRRELAAKCRRFSEIRQSFERGEKYVLHQVVHLVPRRARQHDAVHHARKAPIKLFERDTVAALGAADEARDLGVGRVRRHRGLR